jgi:hypothetical protein
MSATPAPLRPPSESSADLLERVVLGNDLAKLSPRERLLYYRQLCASLDVNPLTHPFRYLYLDGKLTLYVTRDGTDQLRKRHEVAITSIDKSVDEGLFIVTAKAMLPNGRTDEDLGAVALEGLKGKDRANAIMRAITKAKRRVTLSILGLGLTDESEVEDIPNAVPIEVDEQTGEIKAPMQGPPMPEHPAEVAYTNVDEERKAWLARITEVSTERKLDVKRRQDLWFQYVGLDATQKTADPAALAALYDAILALPKP